MLFRSGVNTAVDAQGQGIGFAIPINVAKSVVDELIKYGKVIRPWLGISYWSVTDEIAYSLKLPDNKGVVITRIIASSPADRYGLKVADVIVKIKGTPINSIGDMEIIETLKIGDRIPFVVLREGKEQTIYVTIGERPQGI